MKTKKGIMVAILACSSLLVTSCYEAYPTYGGVAVGVGPGGVGVSASAEWTNASYDASGYPIYGYSYGRPVYGYTAAGVAIFTLAALTTAYYLPYWGCAHWCHHHDVYIHYCPHHHHKCWAPPRCPRGHMPHVRPPHDGPHPGRGEHVKAPSHRGVPDSGRPPQHMQGGPNHGMQPGHMQGGPNRGMQPGNMQAGSNRGMQPVRGGNARSNVQSMPRGVQASDMNAMRRGGMNNGMQRGGMNSGMQPMQNNMRRGNMQQPRQIGGTTAFPSSNRMRNISTPSGNIRNYGPGGGARTSFGSSRASSPSFGGSRSSAPSFGGSRSSAPSFGGGGGHRSSGFGGGGFGGGGHRGGGFGGGGHHGRH